MPEKWKEYLLERQKFLQKELNGLESDEQPEYTTVSVRLEEVETTICILDQLYYGPGPIKQREYRRKMSE